MINSNRNFVTIEEFLRMAVQFEADSARFYQDMKTGVNDENTLELLDLLVREETAHMKRLQAFQVKGGDAEFIQFPPSLSLSMPAPPNEPPDLDACIEIGLTREEQSVAVYTHAASMVKGDFQQMLTGLANFERQHVEKLLSLKRFFQQGA